MTPEVKKRLVEFLRALAQLTEESGIKIEGCGCCSSPWLADLKSPEDADGFHEAIGNNLEYRDGGYSVYPPCADQGEGPILVTKNGVDKK